MIRLGWLVACLLVLGPGAAGQADEPPKIVLLYTHDRFLPGNIKFDGGFRAELEKAPAPVEVFEEYLDIARFPGPERDVALEGYLATRYAKTPPRVLVAVGDPALQFFMQRRQTLFPGTPIVLVGIAPEAVERLRKDPLVAGVEQAFRIGPTLDSMLALRPALRRIVMVSGASDFDRLWDPWVKEEQSRLAGRVELEHWAGTPLSEVLEKARGLPQDAAIFYLSYLRDPDGTTMSGTFAAGKIAGAAPVPVFGLYETYLGTGVVGGQVNELSEFGSSAATIVNRLVAEETPAQIGILPSPPQRFVFDDRQLEKWKIPRRDLPPGSEVRFKKRSFYQDHRRVAEGVAIAVLLQSSMIAALLVQRRRRQSAENELRLSKERYREVVDTQTEMVCRYRADTTLTFVNEAYCRFFDKTREELLGKSFLMLIPDEEHAAMKASLQRIIEERQPVSIEHPVNRPDGSVGWMQWDDLPVFNARGELEELQGIGRDITRRRRAQEELRQSEERFAGVFRGSPMAISILRQSDGRLVDVNPSWERFFELDRSEAVGRSPVELGLIVSPESNQRFGKFLESGGALRSFEQMVLTRSGATRWMSISSELIPLGGEPCFIVMSKDITELREVEDARQSLAQATRLAMLGELTASIAHEVNQPLGAILNNAETAEIMLRSDTPSLDELRQILADIRRDDIRASEVIKRVRALVGKRETKMAPLYLNDVLGDVIRMIEHDCQRRGVTLTSELALNLPAVAGDRVQIEQVMLNLLINAMDAIKAKPLSNRRLVLRSAPQGAMWIEASVEDNGHGMSPGTLERIFDSFYSTKEQGMGLGLALARSIAEAHGGRLTAENNAGSGATFRLILPVHDG